MFCQSLYSAYSFIHSLEWWNITFHSFVYTNQLHSGALLVHSALFWCHSALFWYIRVPFLFIPFYSGVILLNSRVILPLYGIFWFILVYSVLFLYLVTPSYRLHMHVISWSAFVGTWKSQLHWLERVTVPNNSLGAVQIQYQKYWKDCC